MNDDKYSFSLTTFNPSGKLVQIEYALNGINNNGKLAIGIKACDGVVLATEKKLHTNLLEEESIRKIEMITENIGCVYSGMPSDYRVILSRSRKRAQMYYLTYKEAIPVNQLVKEVAMVMQEYTQSGGVRPFGLSLLVAGYNKNCENDGNGRNDQNKVHYYSNSDYACKPELYQIDPSGTFFAWKASAIGKDSQNCKNFLEKRYLNSNISGDENCCVLELEDAIHISILALKESFEGPINENNIEIGIISDKETIFRRLSAAEIKDYINEIE